MRSLIELLGGSPARLMVGAWLLLGIIHFFSPIEYDVAPSEKTMGLILLYLGTFVVGTWCAPSAPRRGADGDSDWAGDPRTSSMLQRVVVVCAIVGSLGALAMAVDKLFLSGLDYSQGVTAVRMERSVQEMSGGDGPARSPLLYLGHLTASFGIVAYLLYFLRGDRFSLPTVALAHLGLLSSAVLAGLYGGRSPLVFVLSLVLAASIVRAVAKRPLLPREKVGRVLLAAFVVAALVYNTYIITTRNEARGLLEYDDYAQQLAMNGAVPAPYIVELREAIDPSPLVGALSTAFYVTHGLMMLERTVDYAGPLGPYLGQYQFSLVSIVLSRFIPALTTADAMEDEMEAAGLEGLFATVWGGMLVDFGPIGTLPVTFVCGWLAGLVFSRARRAGAVGAQLVMCYAVAAILWSPVVSPFVPYVSLPVLASTLICAWVLSRLLAPRQDQQAVPAASTTARRTAPAAGADALLPASPRTK